MLLSPAEIYNLARDKAAYTRAKKSASARKWRDLASTGKITWGECKSSAAAYYKVIIDASNSEKHKFYCNCPSRQKPCKHSIALAILVSEQSGAFRIAEGIPAEVREILEKKNAPPPTPEALAAAEQKRTEERRKSREKRLAQMSEGLKELDIWLADILRQGLARTEEQGDTFWENLAARMTDAKLGGIGKRVLQLQNLRGTPAWHEKTTAALGDIYLLSQGFQNLEKLPPTLQDEILNLAGINQKREEVLQFEGFSDTWLVIGQSEHTADEKIYERRTWLYGENIDRIGLVLDFAFQTEPYPENFKVGHIYEAEMVFYPAAYPLRMLAKSFRRKDEVVNWQGYPDFTFFAGDYAEVIAHSPWMSRFPAFFTQVVPLVKDNKIRLIDQNNNLLEAHLHNDFTYKLIALSGGHPIDVFGEWDGEKLQILSAVAEDRFVHFTRPPLKRKEPEWRRF